MLETASGYALSLSTKPEISSIHRSLLGQHSPVDIDVFNTFGATIERKKEGSAVFRFANPYSKYVSAVKDKIQEGAITHMVEDIIKHMDDSNLSELSEIKVKLRCFNDKESNMSKSKKKRDE